MNRSRIVMVIASLTLALLTTGCGNQDVSAESPEAIPGAGASDGQKVTIHLTANDQMQYDKKTFAVPAGATVHLILEDTGKLPATVMGHDVAILHQGEDAMKFGGELVANGAGPANDYLPASMRSRVLAHTDMIGGGEKTSIEFTAPAPGKYDYLCTFPGHFAAMNGVMIVE